LLSLKHQRTVAGNYFFDHHVQSHPTQRRNCQDEKSTLP
jgi:hypothetical protein